MVRPVRMSIVAILAILVLFTLQIDVSAKKKSSKRKNRKARSVPVMLMLQRTVQPTTPVIVTPPALSPVIPDSTLLNMSAPGQRTSSSTPMATSSSGSGTPVGDNEGKGKNIWTVRPRAKTAGALIISEFRLKGTNGPGDEYIEIYNDSGADHTVTASSGTGYAIAASDGTVRCSIPNGTVIPARGHYLCANNGAGGYSLGNYPAGNGATATPDATYTTQITDAEDTDPDPMVTTPAPRQGIALFDNNTGGGSFSLATRFDAVGPTEEANTLYKEGTGLPNLTPFNIDMAWFRDECGKSGSITTLGVCTISTPKDTNNNSADFIFVDTNGTSAGAGQRLGAPGPQNLSSSIQRNSTIPENMLDATVPRSNPPNRVRDFTGDAANNSTFGTLSIRRRFVNNTGGNLTSLRFRVIDITTFPAPSGFADLRPRTTTAVVIAGINDPATCTATGAPATPPCSVTAQGTTLDQSDGPPPPLQQPNGGGFNSSLTAGTVTLATPLAPGASINLIFLMGIQQTGQFKVYVNIEALP